MYQGGGKGTVFFSKKQKRLRPADEPVERVSRARQRACVTQCAFICDRPEIQKYLPQIIIGNDSEPRARQGTPRACSSRAQTRGRMEGDCLIRSRNNE